MYVFFFLTVILHQGIFNIKSIFPQQHHRWNQVIICSIFKQSIPVQAAQVQVQNRLILGSPLGEIHEQRHNYVEDTSHERNPYGCATFTCRGRSGLGVSEAPTVSQALLGVAD